VARRVADGHAPVKLHELFGSTETGLVATREVSGRHDPPWELARDVTFAEPPTTVRPVRLAVAGPRLARPPGRPRPARHTLTDEVEPLDDRRFRLVGRSTRLIKLGGRRVDLDAVEASLRHVLDCRDLACAGLRDDLRAESYELLVVPHRGRVVDLGEVRRKAREALGRGCEPRRVRVVAELARSGTGKVLWEQPR
jgi:acyl-coenzyme A synthetase/AMP-(fatty) acid ligase